MLKWEILAARFALDKVGGDEAVAIALRELERGSDSIHWATLAGEVAPTEASTASSLRSALGELGVTIPAREEAREVLYQRSVEEIDERLASGEFVKPWICLSENAERREAKERQLLKEVCKGHQLYRVPVRLLAVRQDRDDALHELLDGSSRVAEVHLTYGGKQKLPLPESQLFSSLKEWRVRSRVHAIELLKREIEP